MPTGSDLVCRGFGCDHASRLSSVTNLHVSAPCDSAMYSYLATSPLVGQIGFRHCADLKMTAAEAYDPVNRLASIQSAVAGANQLPQLFGYHYDFAGQRQRVALADGSFWRYEYDALG